MAKVPAGVRVERGMHGRARLAAQPQGTTEQQGPDDGSGEEHGTLGRS